MFLLKPANKAIKTDFSSSIKSLLFQCPKIEIAYRDYSRQKIKKIYVIIQLLKKCTKVHNWHRSKTR